MVYYKYPFRGDKSKISTHLDSCTRIGIVAPRSSCCELLTLKGRFVGAVALARDCSCVGPTRTSQEKFEAKNFDSGRRFGGLRT